MDKINTLPVKEKTVEVMKNLKGVLNDYATYSSAVAEIEGNTMFSREYKDEKIRAEKGKVMGAVETKFKNIYQCIDVIEDTLKKNDAVFDFSSPEFTACLTLMTTSQKAMRYETLMGIVSKFKGNRQALLALASVANATNVDTIQKLIINTEAIVENLRDRVMSAEIDFPNSIIIVPDIKNEFIKLVDLCGEKLTPEETDLGATYNDIVNMQMRVAMGLSI